MQNNNIPSIQDIYGIIVTSVKKTIQFIIDPPPPTTSNENSSLTQPLLQ